MLIMLPNRMRRLPMATVFPYNADDLMIATSDKFVFHLTEISDEDGNAFSIRAIMKGKPEIFGKQIFEDRLKEFSKILFARLERFFVTQKTDYLFFDKEEQAYMTEKIFGTNALMAKVNILRIKDGGFEKVDLDEVRLSEFAEMRKEIASLGILAAISPANYVAIMDKASRYDKVQSERMAKYRQDRRLRGIFSKYSGIELCQSQKDVNLFYRSLAKELHPDVNGGKTTDEFQKFQEDFKYVKESKWYKGLVM